MVQTASKQDQEDTRASARNIGARDRGERLAGNHHTLAAVSARGTLPLRVMAGSQATCQDDIR